MQRERPGHSLQEPETRRWRAAVSLEEVAVVGGDEEADLATLDEAMKALERIDPRKAKVVEIRFFGGLSVEETAEALKVSLSP